MRMLVPGLMVAAAMALSVPASAVTVGQPSLVDALQDLSVVDQVHCVPGWPHHVPTNWRRRDGCARVGVAPPVVVRPPVVVVPRRGWCHRRPWSGGRVPC